MEGRMLRERTKRSAKKVYWLTGWMSWMRINLLDLELGPFICNGISTSLGARILAGALIN